MSPDLRFRHELLAFLDLYFIYRRNQTSSLEIIDALEARANAQKVIAYEDYLLEHKAHIDENAPHPIDVFLAKCDNDLRLRRRSSRAGRQRNIAHTERPRKT